MCNFLVRKERCRILTVFLQLCVACLSVHSLWFLLDYRRMGSGYDNVDDRRFVTMHILPDVDSHRCNEVPVFCTL